MSDPVTRQAEKWLRDIKREFILAVGRNAGTKPGLTISIARGPVTDVAEHQHTVSSQVFEAFRDALLAETKTASDQKTRVLRIDTCDNANHPWFDISYQGSEYFFVFRVHEIHPISNFKSAG